MNDAAINANLSQATPEADSGQEVKIGRITGWIKSIYSRRYGGAIFKLEGLKGNTVVVKAAAKDLPSDPLVGELWKIEGHMEVSPDYGEQIIPHQCERLQPSGDVLVDFLERNKKFHGITAENGRARLLWAKHGMELYDILDRGDVDALTDGGVLPERYARHAIEVWQEYRLEAPIIRWLQENQFPRRLASIIREYYGADAIVKLGKPKSDATEPQGDPFRMLAFASWEEVAALARRLGFSESDPEWEAAAVESTLYDLYDDGHTAATRQMLNDGLKAKIGKTIDELGDAWQDRAVEWIGEDLFQSSGACALEMEVTRRINEILVEAGRRPSLFAVGFDPERLRRFEARESADRAESIKLNRKQVVAIQMILTNPLSVVKGPPGSGKTTLLKALVDQLGPDALVYQMAVTGRAMGRMEKTTGLPAKTICAFLIQARKEGIPAGYWLLIDEASMIDLPMMARILEVLPEDGHICLIGDEHQLPPVGPGLVFHKMVESSRIPQTELVEIHRAAMESGIPQVAHSIREQKAPEIKDFTGLLACGGKGVWFIEANTPEEIRKATLRTYRQLLKAGEVQIIAARNATCNAINQVLHNEHKELREMDGMPVPMAPLRPHPATLGDPLLHHSRNDYERDLYNGTLGVLTDVFEVPVPGMDAVGHEVEYVAAAEFDGAGTILLTDADFEYLSLGYVITGHKAQGSEWPCPIVICEDAPMVDNTWLYTAITRGKELVIIIGSRAVFRQRVENAPLAHRRITGMKL